MTNRAILAVMAATLAGCGWAGDSDLFGMRLDLRTDAFDRTTLRAQVRDAAAEAAKLWGGDPRELSGWRLVVKDGDVWCDGGPGHDGCTDPWNATITVTTRGTPDFVHSTFVHEAGHVFLEDPDHGHPEWKDCEAWHTLWLDWANSYGYELAYLGEWAGNGQSLGTCSPTCEYRMTSGGPELIGCSYGAPR